VILEGGEDVCKRTTMIFEVTEDRYIFDSLIEFVSVIFCMIPCKIGIVRGENEREK
jgi:hypothetical protein